MLKTLTKQLLSKHIQEFVSQKIYTKKKIVDTAYLLEKMEAVAAAGFEGDLNLKATELTLGLPGTESQGCNKRPSSGLSVQNEKESEAAPPAKSQIVGWPPVRNYRKNALQAKKNEADACGIYVKVSMDGAPYLRKIDLKIYSGYAELLEALEAMFKFNAGQYSETEGYKGSDYEPTYEDKDGDWMLVGDVPWEMFMSSCKRLRIIKGSEARGLGSGAYN